MPWRCRFPRSWTARLPLESYHNPNRKGLSSFAIICQGWTVKLWRGRFKWNWVVTWVKWVHSDVPLRWKVRLVHFPYWGIGWVRLEFFGNMGWCWRSCDDDGEEETGRKVRMRSDWMINTGFWWFWWWWWSWRWWWRWWRWWWWWWWWWQDWSMTLRWYDGWSTHQGLGSTQRFLQSFLSSFYLDWG